MQMFEASEAVKEIHLLFFAGSSALHFKLLKIIYTIDNIIVSETLIIHNVQYFYIFWVSRLHTTI